MKKYKHLLDLILLQGLATMTFITVNPNALVMPTSLQMLLLASILGLMASFFVIFWREQPSDERELQNQAQASRYAYFAGAIVLIIALLLQSFKHQLDVAIPIALFVMIATKIIIQGNKDNQ